MIVLRSATKVRLWRVPWRDAAFVLWFLSLVFRRRHTMEAHLGRACGCRLHLGVCPPHLKVWFRPSRGSTLQNIIEARALRRRWRKGRRSCESGSWSRGCRTLFFYHSPFSSRSAIYHLRVVLHVVAAAVFSELRRRSARGVFSSMHPTQQLPAITAWL